jgi:phosphopantothenoylcysteine decarboxylase/phosphopantothenate--cysteine ligase
MRSDQQAREEKRPYPMSRFLITAGPTREYLDGVRFLSNASSGRMGMALAEAILAAGHAVDLVVGPVEVPVPAGCEVARVETTRQMYDATLARLDRADVVIAAAAVCDFRPAVPHAGKLKKTGGRLVLEFVETEDILAEIGRRKGHRFVLGFALEASDGPAHARRKMRDKRCDAIVLNAPAAIGASDTTVSVLTADGTGEWSLTGSKREAARRIVEWVLSHPRKGS